MHITYKTHNIDLTDELRSYAEDKVSAIRKLFAHHREEDIACEVVLARDEKHASGLVFRADFTAYAGVEKVHAVGHGESPKAAMDLAKDELVRRANREKTKHQTLLRRGRAKVKEWLRFGQVA